MARSDFATAWDIDEANLLELLRGHQRSDEGEKCERADVQQNCELGTSDERADLGRDDVQPNLRHAAEPPFR